MVIGTPDLKILFFFRWDYSASHEDMLDVVHTLNGDLVIPENFSLTVPAYDPSHPQPHTSPSYCTNPQTTELCATLGLIDIYDLASQAAHGAAAMKGGTEEEDDQKSDSVDESSECPTDTSFLSNSYNPDEITIEDEWDEEEEKGKDGGEKEQKVTDAVVPVVRVETQNSDGDSSPHRTAVSRLILPAPKTIPKPEETSNLDFCLPSPTEPTQPSACFSQMSSDEEEGNVLPARVPKRSSEETKETLNSTNSTPRIKRRNQTIYTAVNHEDS